MGINKNEIYLDDEEIESYIKEYNINGRLKQLQDEIDELVALLKSINPNTD